MYLVTETHFKDKTLLFVSSVAFALRGVFFQNGGNLAVSDKVTSKKHWYPSVFLSENVSDI